MTIYRCYAWSGDASDLLRQQATAWRRRAIRPMTVAELRDLANTELRLTVTNRTNLRDVTAWLWSQMAPLTLDPKAARPIHRAYLGMQADLYNRRDTEWSAVDGRQRRGYYLAVLQQPDPPLPGEKQT